METDPPNVEELPMEEYAVNEQDDTDEEEEGVEVGGGLGWGHHPGGPINWGEPHGKGEIIVS